MRNILWHLVGVVFFIIVFSACAAKVTGPSVTTEEEQRATTILQLKAQAWRKEQEVRLLRIAERLMAVVDSPKPLKFHLVTKPIGGAIRPDDVNAWTDGDNIYVTRGLLRFIQNDDELAIIIAHEIAHAVRGHVSEKLARAAGGCILGIILESLTGIEGTWDLATQMFQLATLEFDREEEREADVYGLTYASRAGYDISVAVDLWERFAIEMPESYIALTHPSSPERFVRAEKIVAMLQSGSDSIEEALLPKQQPEPEETESNEILIPGYGLIPREQQEPLFKLTPEQENFFNEIFIGVAAVFIILIIIASSRK